MSRFARYARGWFGLRSRSGVALALALVLVVVAECTDDTKPEACKGRVETGPRVGVGCDGAAVPSVRLTASE